MNDIDQALAVLRAGGLVAIPTETVYGLAADVSNPDAVRRIFAVKHRPVDHPLIVHIATADQLGDWAATIPPTAAVLADSCWPGPLTLLVPRATQVLDVVTGGLPTVGVRVPAHPLTLELLDRLGGGLAAPSANRFGRVSPTSAAHVADEFGDALWLLDGGDCPLGIESSIVDCSRGAAVLLRPGVLSRDQLEAALGQTLRSADELAPRAPGTLASHYAPRARLRLLPAAALEVALEAALHPAAMLPARLAVYSQRAGSAMSGLRWHRMPDDPACLAHELFAVIRQLDGEGATDIWVEQPPEDAAWEGVLDRLRRAATAEP